MITLSQLTSLFGWASAINLCVLIVIALLLISFRQSVANIHGKMFNLDEKELSIAYFNYLSNYKTLTFIFCLAPYIALRCMS